MQILDTHPNNQGIQKQVIPKWFKEILQKLQVLICLSPLNQAPSCDKPRWRTNPTWLEIGIFCLEHPVVNYEPFAHIHAVVSGLPTPLVCNRFSPQRQLSPLVPASRCGHVCLFIRRKTTGWLVRVLMKWKLKATGCF